MLLACGYGSWRHGAAFLRPANSLYDWTRIPVGPARTGYLFFLDLVVYGQPQVMAGWIGGWLSARFWRDAGRR